MIAEFFQAVEIYNFTSDISKDMPQLKNKLSMLIKYIQNGKISIAVFGSGGVGKTTLGHFLTNNPKYKNPLYAETASDEKVDIGKNIIGKYWIAPGQENRIERFAPEMWRQISNGNVQGLINVVSYGYHSVESNLSIKSLGDYYVDGMTDEQFLKVYLEKRREVELKRLKELTPRLKDAKKPIFMITLVTKQDLWWGEKEIVKTHYTQGAYNDEIESIFKQRGKENFEHIYISASVFSNNFVIGKTILKKVTEGYDENLRLTNLKTFINQLETQIRNI